MKKRKTSAIVLSQLGNTLLRQGQMMNGERVELGPLWKMLGSLVLESLGFGAGMTGLPYTLKLEEVVDPSNQGRRLKILNAVPLQQ